MWTLDAESGRAPHKILIKCILQLNPAERCSELALGGNDLRSQGSLGSCRCTHIAVGGFLVLGSCAAFLCSLFSCSNAGLVSSCIGAAACQSCARSLWPDARCKMQNARGPRTNQPAGGHRDSETQLFF